MKVSVVILNWNGSKLLRKFLPTVLRHTKGEDIEICVADNGSTDNSIEMLRKEYPEVRIITLHNNYGFADGYNRALKEVDSKYVVLLNSDVEVTPQWLLPLVQYLDSHPETAACQPKIRSWRNKNAFEYAGAAGGFIDEYGYPFCRGRIMQTVENDEGQYNTVIPVFWATGAALAIRLDEYWKAGGLDARFFAHMEEIDLCWRLNARGKEVACVPQSAVYHMGGATLRKESPQKTFLNFRNNLIMLYKNLPDKELKKVMQCRKWLDRLAMLSFLAKGQIGNARAVWNARKEFLRLKTSFLPDRENNLRKALPTATLNGRIKGSILWRYYAKGCKRFSSLQI